MTRKQRRSGNFLYVSTSNVSRGTSCSSTKSRDFFQRHPELRLSNDSSGSKRGMTVGKVATAESRRSRTYPMNWSVTKEIVTHATTTAHYLNVERNIVPKSRKPLQGRLLSRPSLSPAEEPRPPRSLPRSVPLPCEWVEMVLGCIGGYAGWQTCVPLT